MDLVGNNQDFSVPPVEGVCGGGTAYGWGHDGVQSTERLRGSIDPTQVPPVDLMNVWCMPSTANVGPQDMPRQLELVNLLAARNERESVQIAIRPKVSWGHSGTAGAVQVQCTDLCSTSGDRLLVGQSVTLRRVVPVLGIPDALVPLDMPASRISLFPGQTTVIWVSIDIPSTQPSGQYEGELIITAIKCDAESSAQSLGKTQKRQLYTDLRCCLEYVEPDDIISDDPLLERMQNAATTLRKILVSPPFAEFLSENGQTDLMDEDAFSDLSIRLKINVTIWDFVLPVTPSLPAVFGISDTVIEDRFGVQRGSDEWYEALDFHFKWLLQYRISPYFCRWGDSMRVLTYTSPWPANHSKSDEYYSDPRLAAYAVPYNPVISRYPISISSGLFKRTAG